MVSLTLLSKKRKHYLTIGYRDASGTEQAAVLALGKDIVRTSLTLIAMRSGKRIEFQDHGARQSGMGGKQAHVLGHYPPSAGVTRANLGSRPSQSGERSPRLD